MGLSSEMAHLYAQICDAGGEIDEAAGKVLDALEKALAGKVDDYAGLILEFKARADRRELEAKRIRDMAGADAAVAEKLCNRLKAAMELLRVSRLEGNIRRVRIQNNGGLLPLEITGDVPDEFTKIKYETDNQAIRDAIARGEKLDFAKLGERGKQVRVE